MNKKHLLFLLFAMFTLAGSRAFATIHTINVGPNQTKTFSPDSITVVLGDTVKWVWAAGTHTTTNDVSGIPVGAASWDQPIDASNTSFMYKPAVTGVYNYHCTFHVSMGMVGKFVVVPAASVNNVASQHGIKLSPNPAKGEFTLNIGFEAKVSLMDISGRVIKNLRPISGTSTELHYSTDGLAEGMYLLKIETGTAVVTEKLQVIK